VIIFLYRDEVYNKNSPNNRGTAEIHVAKQRNGPTGTVKLSFEAACTKFHDHSGLTYEQEVEVY
jgi:replicative DNA helicase